MFFVVVSFVAFDGGETPRVRGVSLVVEGSGVFLKTNGTLGSRVRESQEKRGDVVVGVRERGKELTDVDGDSFETEVGQGRRGRGRTSVVPGRFYVCDFSVSGRPIEISQETPGRRRCRGS